MLVLGDVEHSTWPAAERAAITEISRSNGTKASRIACLVPRPVQILAMLVALADDGLAACHQRPKRRVSSTAGRPIRTIASRSEATEVTSA